MQFLVIIFSKTQDKPKSKEFLKKIFPKVEYIQSS